MENQYLQVQDPQSGGSIHDRHDGKKKKWREEREVRKEGTPAKEWSASPKRPGDKGRMIWPSRPRTRFQTRRAGPQSYRRNRWTTRSCKWNALF